MRPIRNNSIDARPDVIPHGGATYPAPGLELGADRLVQLLTRAGRVLGSSINLEHTLRQLLDLLVPELGDVCVLHLLGSDAASVEIELTRAIPSAAAAFDDLTRRFPAAARPSSPLALAIRTGRPHLIEQVTDAALAQFATTPEQLDLIRRLRVRSLLVAPIRTPDRIWGALGLFLVEGGQAEVRFGATEQTVLEEIADRAGLAVSHASLFRQALEARSDAEYAVQLAAQLQHVTAALAAADTPDAVYDVIIDAVRSVLGAIGGGILEASADEEVLHLRRIVGFSGDIATAYATIPLRAVLDAGPGQPGWLAVHDAWVSGKPVWIHNLAQWTERYATRPSLVGPDGDASWGALPLHGGDRLQGVLTLTWPDPRRFTEQERMFGTSLASQCGQALERARLRASEAAALRAAARAEQDLTTAMAQVSDAIMTLDVEHRCTFINPAAAARIRQQGIEPEQLLGRVLWEAVPQLRDSSLEAAIRRAQADNQPRHFEEYYPVLAAWHAVDVYPSTHGVTLVARDVTIARALHESEQRLRGLAAVVHSSRDAIVSKTLDGTVRNWNRSAERIFGWSSEEMVGGPIFRVIPESLHDEERELLRRVASGEVIESFEAERIRKDGRRIMISVTLSPVHDAAGRVVGVSSIKRDVTEQRQIRRALQESEARLQAVLQQLPSGVIIAEAPSGRLIQASRQVEAIWRRSTVFANDVEGYAVYEGFHPDGRPYAPDEWPLARAMATGETVLNEEIRIRRGDGTMGWISVNAGPLRDQAGTIIGSIVAFSDITAQRDAEDRLRQAAKMESIGRLAGGLAHDFNNQLSAVTGFAQFVERDPGLGARARQDLLQVQQAAERMASLTRQLLAFSRQQILTPETIDLNGAVADAHPLLQRLIGAQIEMRIETPATPIWIRADRSQLLQVLMNLAINARDAMPHGGTLTVRSRLRPIAPHEMERPDGPPLDPGAYAELVVVDSGTGISPEALPNIFEPFFTTKEVGKGTGLGLATVHGIVTQSRGAVWAESTFGKGAAFHVLLPLAAAPDIPAAAVPGTTPAGESRGRVLVVEDEDHVRQLLIRMLTEAGFDVVQARHGGEALERLAEARGTVDVVLSDVVMPVMAGRQLAVQLKQRYPGIPVIWMSGYPSESLTAEQFLPDGAPFLQKPMAPELLIETVRRALAQRPSVR